MEVIRYPGAPARILTGTGSSTCDLWSRKSDDIGLTDAGAERPALLFRGDRLAGLRSDVMS
jgi:hypothetical protein